jgi:hypothetical protein
MRALRRFHDREAHRVRVGNGPRSEPSEPLSRDAVIIGCCEVNDDARARVDSLERTNRWLVPRAEQRQSMQLGNNEIGCDQRNALFDGCTEGAICCHVVLVAPAAQRDPRPTIDEQPCGDVRGTWRATRQ